MKRNILLFFISSFFLSGAAFPDTVARIKKEGELRVCTSAGYAPFEVKTSSGEWVGFDIRMFSLFAKQMGVNLNMIDMRWEGVFPALLASKCDFITGGMSITEDRQKVIQFSSVIYKSGNAFVVSSKVKDKYKTLSDLDKTGVRIAVKTGNTADFFLKKVLQNAKILRFDTNADMLTAVLENRVEALAQDSIYAFMASNEHRGKLTILENKINYENLAVGLRKKDPDLLKSFNSFFESWKKSGGYDKAVKYYIESDEWTVELKK